jgi:hypothetical protein
MRITLELTPPQAALLKALAPRGNAVKSSTPMEDTALKLLTGAMTPEATMRRINTDAVLDVALVEAAKRRRERETRA